MGTSSSGVAISARGTGQIWSSADSRLFLSPHDLVARENDPSVLDVIYLDNGGAKIVNQSGTNVTRYVSLPVSTFGTLFASNTYVEELNVCYKAPSASTYIDVTAVIKNDGAEAAEFYIIDQTNRVSDTHDCYTLTADPRVRINNSSWAQFNVRFSGVGSEIYIYTVKLTLTQESS